MTTYPTTPFLVGVLLLMAVMLSAAPASAARGPSNDSWRKATTISGLPYTVTQDTRSADSRGDPPTSGCSGHFGVGYTVWYAFTPDTDMSVTADTFGSTNTSTFGYDTHLTVYTRTSREFTEVTCNDDGLSSGLYVLQSQVTFNATAGTTYYFKVGSYADNDGGDLVFNVQSP